MTQTADPVRAQTLPEMIAGAAEPLPAFDDPAFGRLFDRWADRRVVLLGEASHGTSEFYRARAAITRHLIEHHAFDVVAVERSDAVAMDRGGEGAGVSSLMFRASSVIRSSRISQFAFAMRSQLKAIAFSEMENTGGVPRRPRGRPSLSIRMVGSWARISVLVSLVMVSST